MFEMGEGQVEGREREMVPSEEEIDG